MSKIATRDGRPAHETAPPRRKAKLTMTQWMAGHGEDADRPEPQLGMVAGFLFTGAALAAFIGAMVFFAAITGA